MLGPGCVHGCVLTHTQTFALHGEYGEMGIEFTVNTHQKMNISEYSCIHASHTIDAPRRSCTIIREPSPGPVRDSDSDESDEEDLKM